MRNAIDTTAMIGSRVKAELSLSVFALIVTLFVGALFARRGAETESDR
jgi:hypothetical protein